MRTEKTGSKGLHRERRQGTAEPESGRRLHRRRDEPKVGAESPKSGMNGEGGPLESWERGSVLSE